MERVLEFIGRHGGPIVFVVVFLDQLGLPIPTIPILLALGALVGTGQIDPVWGIVLAITGSVCADLLWFQLGRWKGARVLRFVCRVALEPDSCVNKTRSLFLRHGVKSLLYAKFVPGLDTVAPPIAGMLGVRVVPFVLWSATGGALWIGTFGGLGYLFSDRLDDVTGAADRLGAVLGFGIAGVTALYVAYKFLQRRRVLRSIRTARITPEELHERMRSGFDVVVLDARDPSALDGVPFAIEGARPLELDDVDTRPRGLDSAREVVVYCS